MRGGAGYNVAYGANSVTLNSTTQPTVSDRRWGRCRGRFGHADPLDDREALAGVELAGQHPLPGHRHQPGRDRPGDYASVPFTHLTFAPGETAKPLNFTVNGDELHEGDESFNIGLAGSGGADADERDVLRQPGPGPHPR